MDSLPITGLDELDEHLDALLADPSLSLNAKLFDHVRAPADRHQHPTSDPAPPPQAHRHTPAVHPGPAVLASLAIKLLGPLPFTRVLSLASEDSLVQALGSPASSANLLAMAVVHKAARTPADAALLSLMTGLLAAFLHCWLTAPQVEVGEKGGRVLGDLLDIDNDRPPQSLPPPPPVNGTRHVDDHLAVVRRAAPGQGRLWRRLFTDRDLYGLLISLCSGRHPAVADDVHQLTLAQGRVLRVLPRLAALNFTAVSGAEFPDLSSGGGLLRFAALHMVDKQDVLMHLSLLDFFEALVSVLRLTELDPPKMDALRALLRDAVADDPVLYRALRSLPERTVPEEADALRTWLRELLPSAEVRVTGWESR